MAVGCQYQPGAAQVEGIEGVEEFALGFFLAGQEMDVVQAEKVGVAVGLAEGVEVGGADGCTRQETLGVTRRMERSNIWGGWTIR